MVAFSNAENCCAAVRRNCDSDFMGSLLSGVMCAVRPRRRRTQSAEEAAGLALDVSDDELEESEELPAVGMLPDLPLSVL